MTALSARAAIARLALAVTVAVRRRAAAAAPPAADQDRYDAIRTARRELKAANREHEAVLREVQRELRRAQAPRELASLAGHTLLDDAIKTPTRTRRLTDAVTATVEVDPRRLCLIIAGDDWVSTAPLRADDVAAAHRFARAVEGAAREAATVTRRRAQRVDALYARLHDARCDRARIDATTARLAHLEATAPAAVARLLRAATDEHPAALPAAWGGA